MEGLLSTGPTPSSFDSNGKMNISSTKKKYNVDNILSKIKKKIIHLILIKYWIFVYLVYFTRKMYI